MGTRTRWSNREINLNRVMHKRDRDLVAKTILGIAHLYDVLVMSILAIACRSDTYLFDISVALVAKSTVELIA